MKHPIQRLCIIVSIGLCTSFLFGQNKALKLLDESLNFHDPRDRWNKSTLAITLRETRPGNPDRQTKIWINNSKSFFKILQDRDGHKLQFIHKGDKTKILFDGQVPADTSIIRQFRLTADRAKTLRNYYSYLYGLPMKLKDPGTQISPEVIDTVFNQIMVWAIKITYPPDIGKDTWYYYFSKESKELVGYRFYHDEAANDGEYVILEGTIKVGSLNLPKIRNWYTNQSGEFLGSDIAIPSK